MPPEAYQLLSMISSEESKHTSVTSLFFGIDGHGSVRVLVDAVAAIVRLMPPDLKETACHVAFYLPIYRVNGSQMRVRAIIN